MDNQLKFGDKVYTSCWAIGTPFGKSCVREVTFVRETKKSILLQYEDASAVFVMVDNGLTQSEGKRASISWQFGVFRLKVICRIWREIELMNRLLESMHLQTFRNGGRLSI